MKQRQLTREEFQLGVLLEKYPSLLLSNEARNAKLLADWLGLDIDWNTPFMCLLSELKFNYQHMRAKSIFIPYDQLTWWQNSIYQFRYALEHTPNE